MQGNAESLGFGAHRGDDKGLGGVKRFARARCHIEPDHGVCLCPIPRQGVDGQPLEKLASALEETLQR